MPEPESALHEDYRLVQRLLAGEETAFDGFAQSHFGPLFRFALSRLGGDEDLSAEIVQMTLVTAFRKLETYRGDSALLTWLCGICHFEIRAHWRRKRRSPAEVELTDQVALPEEARRSFSLAGQGPAESLERKEVAAMVHRTLDELPSHYGQVLEWKYIEGLPVKVIADRLSLGPKAAESVLTRARQAFQKAYASIFPGAASPSVLPWTATRRPKP